MVGTWRQNWPLCVGYEYSAQEPTYRALNPVQLCFTNPSASSDSPQQEPSFQRANEEQSLRSHHLSPTRSTRTQCCTASKADRIRLLKQEAAERLADIERRKQQLVADLLHEKLEAILLEADIANLQCYSIKEPNTKFNIEDRLCHADPTGKDPIYDSTKITHVKPVTNKTEPKPERVFEDLRVSSPTKSCLNIEHHNLEKTLEMLRATKDRLAFDTIKQNRIDNLCQTIPQELLCYEHLQNLDPSEVCNKKARPRMLIDSNNFELIVSKRLTGGRNEPVASPELGWAINGTTPRATIINEDDERVLCLSAGNCTKSARHELDALAHSLEPDAMSVTDVQIQTEETVEPQLPRYYNTRGVRTFQRPFRTKDQEKIRHRVQQNCWAMIVRAKERNMAFKYFSGCATRPKRSTTGRNPCKLVNCRSDPCGPVACTGHYVQADESYIPTSNQRQLVKKKRHKRTGGGGCHRTIKTLAVLTKIKKLRESFAEGRMLRTGAPCHAPRRQ